MREEKPLTRQEVIELIEERMQAVSARTSMSQAPNQVFQQQADVAISQANPVSTTLYEVLPTAKNVRVISIYAETTGGTVDPLDVVVTIDGETITYTVATPGSGTPYFAINRANLGETAQALGTTDLSDRNPFIREGRSVKVEARVTWTVQPNPLQCRVKYAMIP